MTCVDREGKDIIGCARTGDAGRRVVSAYKQNTTSKVTDDYDEFMLSDEKTLMTARAERKGNATARTPTQQHHTSP